MEGMVDETGKPHNCVCPEPRRGGTPGARRLRGHAATRSSTSTRCSTSATARTTTCRSTELARDLQQGGQDPQLHLHLAQPLQRRPPRPVPGRHARRAGRRRRLPGGVGAEDPRLARLQEGRPADRHLRPARPRPGPEPVAAPAPATRCKVGACCSRASSPRRDRRRRPTTPTRCCARSRISSASRRCGPGRKKKVSLGDDLLGPPVLGQGQGSWRRKSPTSGPK